MTYYLQQQDLLSNVSDFETPAINPPSPEPVIETNEDIIEANIVETDVVEPENTIIATKQIETNNEKSTTPKKVSLNLWVSCSPFVT